MGKYTSVKVTELENAVSDCLTEIIVQERTLQDIEDKLDNSDDFKGNKAVENIKKEINRLHSASTLKGGINDVKNKLNVLNTAIPLIKKCQEYEKEMNNASNDAIKLEKKALLEASELAVSNILFL